MANTIKMVFLQSQRKPFSVRPFGIGYYAVLMTCLMIGGCTATSKYMVAVPKPAPALTPPTGKAMVVFLRPSGLGGAITFMIIEQNGRFIGDSTAGGHFPAVLDPGEYLFIAEGENTAVMHANLGPDRLYYVEVDPKMGVFSARVGLEPIKPGSEAWAKVPDMLNKSDRFAPALSAGQAQLDADASGIQKRIANAKQKWAGFSPAERAELSLEPNDGVGSSVAVPRGAAVPPPLNPPAASAGAAVPAKSSSQAPASAATPAQPSIPGT